ncbi:LTA synthase family protein [Frateuria sp. Soil773]|uniref:LTA synthase family protein n=1 Tax=Frateuria sp. Soil773 TaxID=1736407 RepID=UPI000ACD26B5|nr:LTA synthase family protein [Frateuria sp. Soil773]
MEFLLLWLLRYADHTKIVYLGINVVYADLTVLGGILENPRLVVGFIHPTGAKIVGVLAAIVGIAVLYLFFRKWLNRLPALIDRYVRISCLFLAVAGLAVVNFCRVPDVIAPLGWEVFSQIHGAYAAGITGNLLLGKMTERSVQRKPDKAAIRAFWQEPAVKSVVAGLEGVKSVSRPDIVVIQSESLFEPSQLCGFPDEPVLKHVAQQRPRGAGNLHVPVFGGRTLQTEFEVHTGVPVDFYPGSMFAYYELVKHPFNALPGLLAQQGYKTLAIHPGNRGFWRRDVAMPDMGFDAFEAIGSFLYPRDFSDRGHVRDAALMRAILAELDAASGPTFITGITIDNHFPYGAGAPPMDAGLGMPDSLQGQARREMSDYLVHAIDADNAYGFLLDALKRRERPTVVLFYGDHLPPLGSVYQELCFKDGKRPEEHFPPFRIWANFPLPNIPDTTYSYLLPGMLMHAAGLPLEEVMLANAVAGIVANNPATGPDERQRILDEYANIAAADTARRVSPDPGRGPVFVSRAHGLKLLMALSEKGKDVAGISPEHSDLYFPRPDGGEVDFKLDGGIGSMTLRPYLGAPTLACMHADTDKRAEFGIEGDGKLLYRVSVTAQSVRLVTLDLKGVRHLKLWTTGSGSSRACSQLFVRVARMRCYSAKCAGTQQEVAHVEASADESRILKADPEAGDIAELASVTPESVRLSGEEKPGLFWLMDRETGRADGYSPISVEPGGRLFMPPADDHSAWIDFDVDALDEVTFDPHINQLTPECALNNESGKESGLVKLAFLLDGKPVAAPRIVDRNYRGAVSVKTDGERTLRIVVDKGNQVSWCDWFSIGVDKLKPKNPGAGGNARLPDVTASYRAVPPPIDQ